MELEPETDTP